MAAGAPPLAYDLKGVQKTYRLDGGHVDILKGIDLQIAQGEYVSIVGPSGSGKSTLMHLLGGLDMPTGGRMAILGHDTAGLDDDQLSDLRCRAMGFIFQQFNLLFSYDAIANVALSMVYTGRPDRWERSRQLLHKLGLGHRLHHRPRALSGGEQQRVAIARALGNDPKILLADEPTGALDQANGRAVLSLLDAFNREGKTIILVTHDTAVAERAHRIVELVDGQVRRDERRRL